MRRSPRRSFDWALPGAALLDKELVEIAARRRTYVVRMAFGAALLAGLAWRHHALLAGAGPFGILGQGPRLLVPLAHALLAGVLVLVPPYCCGLVARERERGSLDLLRASPLPELSLLLVKLAAGLVPALSLIGVALPLLAVALAMGGLSSEDLFRVASLLLATLLLLGAGSLVASCRCSSAGASLGYTLLAMAGVGGFDGLSHRDNVPLAPVRPLLHTLARLDGTPSDAVGEESLGFRLALTCVQLGLLIAVARRALDEDHGPAGTPWWRHAWNDFEREIVALNARLGGVSLAADKRPLPDDEPLRWRESYRPTTLARMFHVALVLSLIASAAMAFAPETGPPAVMAAWTLSLLIVALAAARSSSRERTAGTLDVLLSTPLPGRAILGQKEAALRPVAILAATSLLGVSAYTVLLAIITGGSLGPAAKLELGVEPLYRTLTGGVLIASGLTAALWLGLVAGLLLRGTTMVVTVMFAVLLALFGPPAVVVALDQLDDKLAVGIWMPRALTLLTAPVQLPGMPPAGLPPPDEAGLVAAVALGQVVLVRAVLLALADRLLGRPLPLRSAP